MIACDRHEVVTGIHFDTGNSRSVVRFSTLTEDVQTVAARAVLHVGHDEMIYNVLCHFGQRAVILEAIVQIDSHETMQEHEANTVSVVHFHTGQRSIEVSKHTFVGLRTHLTRKG